MADNRMQTDFTPQENCPEIWRAHLPVPHREDHKYRRGHSVIVGGGVSHSGAALLAAEAALRVGSGLVTQLVPQDALFVYAAASRKAVMTRDYQYLPELLEDERTNAWLLGPGLGVNETTCHKVEQVLKWRKSAVLDADVLTAFGERTGPFFELLDESCLLTPHEGEFARLFPNLQGTKVERAQQAAMMSGAVILLKGAHTVIAQPDGFTITQLTEASQLATAGTGDVLAGLCTGLIAQGMEPAMAAAAGAWIHAQAAMRFGRGLIADDLLEIIPPILQELT
jgi:NAD(P)H-hydrate epimerase